jgi:hypothetical protein
VGIDSFGRCVILCSSCGCVTHKHCTVTGFDWCEAQLLPERSHAPHSLAPLWRRPEAVPDTVWLCLHAAADPSGLLHVAAEVIEREGGVCVVSFWVPYWVCNKTDVAVALRHDAANRRTAPRPVVAPVSTVVLGCWLCLCEIVCTAVGSNGR